MVQFGPFFHAGYGGYGMFKNLKFGGQGFSLVNSDAMFWVSRSEFSFIPTTTIHVMILGRALEWNVYSAGASVYDEPGIPEEKRWWAAEEMKMGEQEGRCEGLVNSLKLLVSNKSSQSSRLPPNVTSIGGLEIPWIFSDEAVRVREGAKIRSTSRHWDPLEAHVYQGGDIWTYWQFYDGYQK